MSNSTEVIKDDWSRLNHHWQDCRSQWNDAIAVQFEREYWQKYEEIMPNIINELELLEHLMRKAQNKVE